MAAPIRRLQEFACKCPLIRRPALSYRQLVLRQAYATQASSQHSIERKPIKKLVIANRGEIACRVMRTAKDMGVETVAVYSEADANSLHVAMADNAYCIGPADSQKSYLDKDKIMRVCKESGSQAVHPGYGFLSENTEFAEMCQQNDITFIGPPSTAIRDMGIKSTSKHIMSAANVPIIEGYHGEDQSEAKLLQESEKIGFPVMIKAVRGGGGKGMRVAMTADEFFSQLASAKNEALKSFNDDVMLIEKFVVNPRHVEVQVFGDHYGNYVYLFERDCSVQRRHQKIIEEAPAPGLSDDVRRQIGEAAVRAAEAVNYVGAGTVEFVMDSEQKFFFMEMNTRLQVEHPVSEMITDTDLVEWQLRVAAGEPLPLSQEDLQIFGHAFEARVYAEDPENDFMPGAGPLHHVLPPEIAPYIRVETGIRQGGEVSVHYDPMIAKLVVWGEDRPTALSRLISALQRYQIIGLNTNINFMLSLAKHPEFQLGNVHTSFIPQHHDSLFHKREVSHDEICLAVMSLLANRNISFPNSSNIFTSLASTRLNHEKEETITLRHQSKDTKVKVVSHSDGSFTMVTGEQSCKVQGKVERCDMTGRSTAIIDTDGITIKCETVVKDNNIYLFTQNGMVHLTQRLPKYLSSDAGGDNPADALAPMPGVVDKVYVQPGDTVEEGQPILVMIAMKMEYVIKAPRSGVVETVPFSAGTTVQKGARLVHLMEQEEEGEEEDD